jgi:hypothetical protein
VRGALHLVVADRGEPWKALPERRLDRGEDVGGRIEIAGAHEELTGADLAERGEHAAELGRPERRAHVARHGERERRGGRLGLRRLRRRRNEERVG